MQVRGFFGILGSTVVLFMRQSSVASGTFPVFALGCGRARRSGMSIAGFAGDDTARAVFPCLSAGRARRQQRQWYVLC